MDTSAGETMANKLFEAPKRKRYGETQTMRNKEGEKKTRKMLHVSTHCLNSTSCMLSFHL